MCFKILLFAMYLFVSNPNLEEARGLLAKGAQEKMYAEQLRQITVNQQDIPLMKAYYAMSYALLAKHSWNPIKKFENVKISLRLLNESVEANPNDIESRFLRFCLEDNIPSFFPFKSHIDDDKKYIISHLDKNHSFYPNIISYLNQAFHLSKEEKNQLPK